MNYPRLPRNVYSYRATIFGLPLRDALIISILASASLLAIRISIYSPLITLSIFPWIVLRKSRQHSRFGRGPKLKMRGKRFGLLVTGRIIVYNDHSFLFSDGFAWLFYEIRGLNVLAMRKSTQTAVMERLRAAIEDAGIGMDFYTVPNKTGKDKHKEMGYSTFVRFSILTNKAEREGALNHVASTGSIFQNSLLSAGIATRELKERDEIEGLLNSLVA